MSKLKIAVIGAGSTYTPELVEGLVRAAPCIGLRDLALMDVDRDRLDIVGGLARRMAAAGGAPFDVSLTTDRREALSRADYVLTQIRVGGMAARILDERIAVSHGVIGQETTGAGGFAKALRTVPVMLDIATDIERVAPDAWLINFTNPSGLITEALLTRSRVNAIGLCNSPIGMVHAIAEALGVDAARLDTDYVGLNHLSWIRGVLLDGVDVFEDVLERLIDAGSLDGFDVNRLRERRLLPNDYLKYYEQTDRVLAEQQTAARTRGEDVRDIERALLARYADTSLAAKPDELEARGGAQYSTAAVSLIQSLQSDEPGAHVVNVLNQGAIEDLPADAAVEVPCDVSRAGARPHRCGRLPDAVRDLVIAVKAYETETIEAAVSGDMALARSALSHHPLVPAPVADRLWNDLYEAHRKDLPQFERDE